MILLIDNYDSFSYNLVQLAGSLRQDVKVVRNDALTVEEVEALSPERIILSPGPGFLMGFQKKCRWPDTIPWRPSGTPCRTASPSSARMPTERSWR